MKLKIQQRFKKLLLEIIAKTKLLNDSEESKIIKRQLIRSSASSAANYRAACRAKSKPDFINKLKIVEEEIDETNFWIDILNSLPNNQLNWQKQIIESNELIAIIVSSIKTIKQTQKS